MREEFKRLLCGLERCASQIGRQTDARINSFEMPRFNVTDDLDEFNDILKRFIWHLYDLKPRIPPPQSHQGELILEQAYRLLQAEYGENARVHAFNIARMQAEGGLHGILRLLGDLMRADLIHTRCEQLAAQHKRSSIPSQLEHDAADYIEQFGLLLPPEYCEGRGLMLLIHFEKVMCEHPFLMLRMRRPTRH